MSVKPEALADRLAAGRLAMVEQLTDEVNTLRRENERLKAVALQAQNAAIDLTKKNERLREAAEAYIRAKDSEGGGKGGFFPKPPTVAHQRRVHLAWQELNAALRREET